MRLAIATVLSLLAAACTAPELPKVAPADLPVLARGQPVAVLFSIPGCRYCRIAERGFQGARKRLQQRVLFRKVMVNDANLDSLRARYDLGPSMPQARLLLGERSWRRLPLTREGDRVATAIRDALAKRIPGTRIAR